MQGKRWNWDIENEVSAKMGEPVHLRTQQRGIPREERQWQTIRCAGDLLQLAGETAMVFATNMTEAN